MLNTTAAQAVSSASRGTRRVIRHGASGAVSRDSSPFVSLYQSLSPRYQHAVLRMRNVRMYAGSPGQGSWQFLIGLLQQSSGSTEQGSATPTLASSVPIGIQTQHGLLYQSAANNR